MKVLYNSPPKNLGVFKTETPVEEYFSYTYLPIKLSGDTQPVFEDRLKPFSNLIGRCCCDFVGEYGLDEYVERYVYLTAKHAYQRDGSGFNRPGWHSDGFLTDDISYIWSDVQSTVFNSGDFHLSQDDSLSMVEMVEQVNQTKNYTLPEGSLIRMDQFVIHSKGYPIEGNRVFFKLVISKDKFDLKGNSKNYLLDYDWEIRERKNERNIPQKLI